MAGNIAVTNRKENTGTSIRIKERMKCHVCGANLEAIVTNLPFKVSETAIVILKGMPVLQCDNCREYLIEDKVLEKVDRLLDGVSKNAELEVVSYAA